MTVNINKLVINGQQTKDVSQFSSSNIDFSCEAPTCQTGLLHLVVCGCEDQKSFKLNLNRDVINTTILIIKNYHLDLSGQIALIKKDQDPEDEASEEVRDEEGIHQ